MRPEPLQTLLIASFAAVVLLLAAIVVLNGSMLALVLLLLMPLAAVGWLKLLRDRLAVGGHSELPRYLSARALHQLARELNVAAKAAAIARDLWGASPQEGERLRAIGDQLRPFVQWRERTGEWAVVAHKHPKLLALHMQQATRELRDVQRRLEPLVREGVAAARRQAAERIRSLHAKRLVARLPPAPRPDPLEGASLDSLLLKERDARVGLDLAVREALDALERAGASPTVEEARALADRGRPDLAADAILAAATIPRVPRGK